MSCRSIRYLTASDPPLTCPPRAVETNYVDKAIACSVRDMNAAEIIIALGEIDNPTAQDKLKAHMANEAFVAELRKLYSDLSLADANKVWRILTDIYPDKRELFNKLLG